jgi:hypothetical protein
LLRRAGRASHRVRWTARRCLVRAVATACWLACLVGAGQAQETKVVDLNRVRLYLPDAALRQRLGDDASPLADYSKSLHKETAAYWDRAEKPKAKGLFVVVGMKPGKKARVWCEAVDGEIPPEALTKLEKKLGDLPAVAVKQGPIAFAVEMKLWGRTPEKFPEMPKTWVEAAKMSKEPLMIPDGLFKVVWPDER